MDNILGRLFGSFFGVILDVLQSFFCFLLFLLVAVLALFFVVYRIHPLRMDPQKLRDIHIVWLQLFRWSAGGREDHLHGALFGADEGAIPGLSGGG